MNVVALVKDTERYVFLYDDVSSSQMLQTLGQYAADKELSFTWYDAAVMSQKVRKLRRASRTGRTIESFAQIGLNSLLLLTISANSLTAKSMSETKYRYLNSYDSLRTPIRLIELHDAIDSFFAISANRTQCIRSHSQILC